ncbi:glycoside hydrolase family 26 protein [Bifidobacterium subtile]|nr:glycosyl hydrolase [Bifidobacterium subtile]
MLPTIMRTLRAAFAMGLAAALMAACVGCAAKTNDAVDEDGTATPAAHALQWGVYLPPADSLSNSYAQVAGIAGARPNYVLSFSALMQPVPAAQLQEIASLGATPILSLEPWDPNAGAAENSIGDARTEQPEFALARIAAGGHDADLTRWATGLRDLGSTVMLRFAHEMNGDWYPWAVGVNGNTSDDYVAAWRHVHDLFRSVGASNVRFLWSPNVPVAGQTSDLAAAYPGADMVDILGLDGYNWGTGDGHEWTEPDVLFDEGLNQLRALDGRQPILISETASAEGSGPGQSKAQWIAKLMSHGSSQKRVTGFIWFDVNKERDWRINSSQAAQEAFKASLAKVISIASAPPDSPGAAGMAGTAGAAD